MGSLRDGAAESAPSWPDQEGGEVDPVIEALEQELMLLKNQKGGKGGKGGKGRKGGKGQFQGNCNYCGKWGHS